MFGYVHCSSLRLFNCFLLKAVHVQCDFKSGCETVNSNVFSQRVQSLWSFKIYLSKFNTDSILLFLHVPLDDAIITRIFVTLKNGRKWWCVYTTQGNSSEISTAQLMFGISHIFGQCMHASHTSAKLWFPYVLLGGTIVASTSLSWPWWNK